MASTLECDVLEVAVVDGLDRAVGVAHFADLRNEPNERRRAKVGGCSRGQGEEATSYKACRKKSVEEFGRQVHRIGGPTHTAFTETVAAFEHSLEAESSEQKMGNGNFEKRKKATEFTLEPA